MGVDRLHAHEEGVSDLLVRLSLWAPGRSRINDYATVAYEAASGRLLWTATFDDRMHGFDSPTAIAVSASGAIVFVTGSAEVKGDIQGYGITYGTVAYQASNGARLWVSAPNVSDCESDYPRSIVISPDGATAFVTGLGTYGCNEFFGGYLTVAYDASLGKSLWVRGNADYDSGSRGAALAMSADGTTVFQTGTLGQLGDVNLGNYETIAWTPQGDQRWSSDYEGPGGPVNGATAIALTHDSSTVLVTGWSKGKSSGRDIATIAYDAANGSELWVSRYDGPAGGTDAATSLAISPDGSTVFVAGASTGSGTGLDYVVIAYAV